MSDRSLGILIFIASIAGAALYVLWLFWPAVEGDLLFYCPWVGLRWAIVVPMLVAVLGIFFIVTWIGWTMATTPPPVTIEELEKEEDKED